jgi:SAM-dependent methyltransferase
MTAIAASPTLRPHRFRPVQQVGDSILDFLGAADDGAEHARNWSAEFWNDLLAQREILDRGEDAATPSALRAEGLLDERGQATEFGRRVAYHLLEQSWQSNGDPLRDVLTERTGLDSSARILDVGCGASHTLHFLASAQPAERVGLDADLLALVLAERLYGPDAGAPLRLLRGDALALPLASASFSHVLSRVSLNYLPQFTALREMVRVLAPGGYLALRIEAVGYDLLLLRKATTLRGRLGRGLGLLAGLLLQGVGVQPALGRWCGQRCFASVYRLSRWLRALGCTVVLDEVVTRSPRCLGFASQKILLARRSRDDC